MLLLIQKNVIYFNNSDELLVTLPESTTSTATATTTASTRATAALLSR